MLPTWFASALAAVSSIAVVAGWLTYLSSIPRGRMPRRPWGTLAVQAAGAAGGVVAMVLGARDGAIVVAPAAFAVFMATFFVWLYAQRNLPAGDLQIEVGGRLRPFVVSDSTGARFDSSSLAGKRVLLKFFRGSW